MPRYNDNDFKEIPDDDENKDLNDLIKGPSILAKPLADAGLTDAYNNQFNNPDNLVASADQQQAPSDSLFSGVSNQYQNFAKSLDPSQQSLPQQIAAKKSLLKRASGKVDASPSTASPISDILSKLMGNDSSELADANSTKNVSNLIASLGKAGNMAGAAISRMPADQGVYNDIERSAGDPVAQVKDQSKLKSEKLSQTEQARKLKDEMDKSDANSPISQQYRTLFKDTYGIDVPETASAANLEKELPFVEKKWQASENAKNRAATLQSKQMDLGSKKQDAAYEKAIGDQKTARGNVEYQSALRNKFAASNANELFNKYPNLNNMTGAEGQLAAMEVARMAQQGVPSEHELSIIAPNSVVQKYKRALGNLLTNKPEAAQAGEFLKVLKDYSSRLENNANKVILRYHKEAGESRQRMMGDTNFNDYKQKFITPYETNDDGSLSSNSQKKYGQDVLDYAKKHKISPEEAQAFKDNYKGN